MAMDGGKIGEAIRVALVPYIPKDAIDEVVEPFVDAIFKKVQSKSSESGSDKTSQSDKDSERAKGEYAKEFFTRLFPKLGLEIEDGKFTTASKLGAGSKIAGGVSDGFMKLMTTSVGILEDIYKRISAASPLLEAVEELFNLAMQLFFMPLGNALGEKLIPAALEMIDDIMDMWDEMGDGGLEEILNTTISKASEVISGMLLKIGSTLSEQGGILGSIGKLFTTLGNFVQNNLKAFLDFSIGALDLVINHFKEFIALFISFKTLTYVLGMAQIAATLASEDNPFSPSKWVGYALLSMIMTGGIAEGGLNIATHAEGGYVSSPQLALLGEGGEGEWVVPDSKVSDFVTQHSSRNKYSGGVTNHGGDSYTINIYGYTDHELGGIIEDKVNEMSNRSRLRSGV